MTGGGPEDGKTDMPQWQDPAWKDAAWKDPAGLERWAKDWITLWQSELTAMAADRELREGWAALMALWAKAATSAASQMAGAVTALTCPPDPHERPSRPATANDAARAAPGAAAPDAGGDEIERLHRRIAALEERLRAVERGRPE